MLVNDNGETVLEIDSRLQRITVKEPTVTEEELKEAFKAFKLKEALTDFAQLSKKIFHQDFSAPFQIISKSAICHPSGIFITQFAIEYLANIFLISGANDYKSESIENKDNLLGLFNIYHNCIIHPKLTGKDLSSLLVPMYFEQFKSQRGEQDLLVRQWIIFNEVRKETGIADFEDIEKIILNETKLTINEIISLSFSMFSYIINNPIFNIGNFSGATIESLKDILTEEKITAFLNLYSVTYKEFRELDKVLNPNGVEEYTKTRFNPLWKRPILRLEENLFLVPSLSAYSTGLFYGLFWWFDDYYRKQSRKRGGDFRKYFGLLFEKYVGKVLADIYKPDSVKPQLRYGTKGNEINFTDWTVTKGDKVYLFEVKANQFPLEVLQKGNPDDIRKQVINKLVGAIKQIYQRVQDIDKYVDLSQFKGKNIIPIIVYFDIPFVSSNMYDNSLQNAVKDLELKYPGIKNFKYNFIGIDELEDFYYCSEEVDIEELLQIVKDAPTTGFNAEVAKRYKDKSRKNFLDRMFKEYLNYLVPELNS